LWYIMALFQPLKCRSVQVIKHTKEMISEETTRELVQDTFSWSDSRSVLELLFCDTYEMPASPECRRYPGLFVRCAILATETK